MIVSDSKGYHLSCYKKYTAIKNKEVESELSKQKALDEQSVLVQSTLQPTAQPASGNWNIVEIIGTICNILPSIQTVLFILQLVLVLWGQHQKEKKMK